MTNEQKAAFLAKWGFVIGNRDPGINTNYPGKFMVAEAYEASELPTADGRNGPWAIVGDDLEALINEAYAVWHVDLDGTSGQDRENYSDDQDRNGYSTE